MSEAISNDLDALWRGGFSIPELWGFTAPVDRPTSDAGAPHLMLWGILGIVEYQTSKGGGHRYLRSRLLSGDWIAIGRRTGAMPGELVVVPKFEEPKFGRKPSAIGDGTENYTDVRIVHARWTPGGE